MTEQEFLRQVWRPYDTVTIDGMTGRVTSVCFSTRSVKASLSKDVHDWFKCDMIDEHKSIKGLPDDDALIEDLHNQIMRKDKRIEEQQAIIEKQNEKLAGVPKDELKKLRKHVTRLGSSLGAVEQHVKMLDEYLTNNGLPQTEEEA